MADDERASRCSNGGGGNSSRSKKGRLHKVPQRGLGVAQLEKIRLEEQQKRDSIESSNNISLNFAPLNAIPLPSNLPSPNALFRPASSVPSSEMPHLSSVSKAILSPRYSHWPAISSSERNLGGENQRLDAHRFLFQPPVNIVYDRNAPNLPVPGGVAHRSLQFQQFSSSSSSMVNPSWGLSPSSPNSQVELPSNQIFFSNSYKPLSPKDDKMVGMKRSYPFDLESPSASSLNQRFGSVSDELASHSNRYSVHPDQRTKKTREGHSNSSPLPERNSIELLIAKGSLTADFLSLAPPDVTPSPGNPIDHRNPQRYSVLQGRESPEIYHKENSEGQTDGQGVSGSTAQSSSNFFLFKSHTKPTTTRASNDNADKIDLNLKL